MLQPFLESFADAKSQYEVRPARKPSLICRSGLHMSCAVLKLQKTDWTNDDLSTMRNQTGIFFSIWVTEAGAGKSRADYNIHAMGLRKLKGYRLAGNAFCDRFRKAFEKVRKSWPNVSTDFGCCTLMQGWYHINQQSVASDAMALMDKFEREVSPIIDALLLESKKSTADANRSRRAISSTA